MAEALLSESVHAFLGDRRVGKRTTGYLAVLKSDDYVSVRCWEPASSPILLGPDPSDHRVSKRRWERQMQDWRRALTAQCRQHTAGVDNVL